MEEYIPCENYVYINYQLEEDGEVKWEDDSDSVDIWNYYKDGGGKNGVFVEKGSSTKVDGYNFGKDGEPASEDMIYWNIILNTYQKTLPKGTIIRETPFAGHEVILDQDNLNASYIIDDVTFGSAEKIILSFQRASGRLGIMRFFQMEILSY